MEKFGIFRALNKGKPIWYSWSLWYSIVSNMTHFSIVWNSKKWPVLNYMFNLYWHKMTTFGIFVAHWLWIKGNQFDILESLIWLIFSFCFKWERKWSVLNYVFHQYLVRKIKTWNCYGSLTLNKGKLIWYSGIGMPLCQVSLTFSFCLEWEKNGLFWTMWFICTDTKWRHWGFSWLTDFK